MKPVISLNGTSADSMVEDRRKVMEALMDAMQVMTALMPHGRDYPNAAEQFRADRDLHCARQQALLDMHDEIRDEALAIQKQAD